MELTTEQNGGSEAAAATTILPCPFCDSTSIRVCACDDDSFIKTIMAECDSCGCSISSSIDWKPYSETKDRAAYETAWKEKITKKWNTRPTAKVIEMALCEVPHLILHPNQLYRFVEVPGCEMCATEAAPYKEIAPQ